MSAIDLNKIQQKKKSTVSNKQSVGWLQGLRDLMNKDINLSMGGLINDTFKEGFYSDLSLLLVEGIPIKTAFTIIAEETEKAKISEQLAQIQKLVVNGEKLADAIKGNKNFTEYEYYSIAIGEESGKLIEILKELSVYFKRKVKLKRQLTSAMIYPAIVLSVSIGAIVFMMNFVVPMFSDVFRRFQGDLPAITKAIISLSLLFRSYFWIVALVVIAAGTSLYTQRKESWFRDYGAQMVLRIPVFGELIRKIYLARFCQSMSLLLRSKMPLIQSLDMVRNMINFYPIQITIDPVKSGIMQGKSMYASLSGFKIYHKKMINMIKVAEDVNKLDEMLAKISMQLSGETEHQIDLFNKLLEPLLIIVLGVVVGTILVAMYLPLFQLGAQIGA